MTLEAELSKALTAFQAALPSNYQERGSIALVSYDEVVAITSRCKRLGATTEDVIKVNRLARFWERWRSAKY